VLSGKESDATVTGTPRAFAAPLALASGATVGKSPPGSVVGPGRNGSAAEEATPAGVRGGKPAGSVVPTPPSPAAAVGEIVVVVEIRALAEAGVAIVGLEPSCLLTLRDETLVMGLGEKAVTIAKQALMFEEFIARECSAGRFQLTLKPAGRPILLHGHCHQKAFGVVSPILEVLQLIPGAKPELIESSCCGMAGSFGYEASHYEVSMAMAEASLLPAIRKASDAIVVADGTSCRHQIADGAGREAIHVARLLASLLA